MKKINWGKFFYFCLTTIISIFCIEKNFSSVYNYSLIDLWILPCIFTIINTINMLMIQDTSVFSLKVINTVSFIKFCFMIFLYYYEETNVYLVNKNMVIFLMCVEMLGIFLIVNLFYRRKRPLSDKVTIEKKINFGKDKMTKFLGISSIIGLMCTIMIIIKQPQLLFSFFSINNNVVNNINGFEYLIYKTTFIIILIIILRIIKDKLQVKNIIKILTSLVLILFFSLNISASFSGNISRWTLLINLFIFYNILCGYYPKQIKLLKKTIIVFVIILVPLTTFLKFDRDDTQSITVDNVSNNMLKSVTYRSLDAYFSGPYQVSVAIKTKAHFKHQIDMSTFINDIFNNFPYFNQYFDQSNTIPSYYNYVYYWNNKIYDKICPMIGQSYIYFGYILSPILTMLFLFFACLADCKIRSQNNEIKMYILSYISIFFSLNMCLNMTIMFQSLWLEILPLYLIYITNVRMSKKI